MISYFTKMYQAVPALSQLQQTLGGTFVSTRSSTLKAILRNYPSAPVAKLSRIFPQYSAGLNVLKQSQLIVTGSPNNALLKPLQAKKYMVFHGTFAPLSVPEVKAMAHFDHLCIIGPRMMDVITEAGLGDKASYSGYLPFLENPQKNEQNRSQFLLSLGLDPAKITVLYLPCGRPIGSWDFMAEKLVRQLSTHYNLILRPHPSHAVTARLKDTVGFLKLQHIISKRGGAYLDLTAQKLAFLYAHGDLVISDGTSPAEESLYYDLPQIFVETPAYSQGKAEQVLIDKNIASDHIKKVMQIYDCGMTLNAETSNINQVIEQSLADTDAFNASRQAYFNYVFGAHDFAAQQNLIASLHQYA